MQSTTDKLLILNSLTSLKDLSRELDASSDVGLGRIQHGREAQGVRRGRPCHEQAVLGRAPSLAWCFRERFFGLAVFHQFEPRHQPHAAHVADERYLDCNSSSLPREVLCRPHPRSPSKFSSSSACDGGSAAPLVTGLPPITWRCSFLGSRRRISGVVTVKPIGTPLAILRAGDHVRNDFPFSMPNHFFPVLPSRFAPRRR